MFTRRKVYSLTAAAQMRRPQYATELLLTIHFFRYTYIHTILLLLLLLLVVLGLEEAHSDKPVQSAGLQLVLWFRYVRMAPDCVLQWLGVVSTPVKDNRDYICTRQNFERLWKRFPALSEGCWWHLAAVASLEFPFNITLSWLRSLKQHDGIWRPLKSLKSSFSRHTTTTITKLSLRQQR